MAYEKLGFVDKVTPLDARHMNHIEEGIAAADAAATNAIAKAEDVAKKIPQAMVETVNGKQPDENGNVEIEIPEMDIPSTVPDIQTAIVGHGVVVKAVDENGKPTEWETVDMKDSIIEALIPMGVIPVILDANGSVLTDANDAMILG